MQNSIRSLKAALRLIAEITGSSLQLSQADVLLTVMESDPDAISYKDVEQLTQLPQTSVARNLRLLGSKRIRSNNPNGLGYELQGLGLIESTIDPWDTRRYAAKLTDKGKSLARAIIQTMAKKNQAGGTN
jgi:DNA-binding MarR family transcriptional regulator